MKTVKNYRALKNNAIDNTSKEVVETKNQVSKETSEASNIGRSEPEYVSYTEAQLNRLMELSQFYSEVDCNSIIINTAQYGPNTFSNIIKKVKVIADTVANHAYFNELASFVELDKIILLADIVGIVNMVRKEMGLARIKDNLVNSCVSDLFQYFTIVPIYSNKFYLNSKKNVLEGYIPTFNLNCQL